MPCRDALRPRPATWRSSGAPSTGSLRGPGADPDCASASPVASCLPRSIRFRMAAAAPVVAILDPVTASSDPAIDKLGFDEALAELQRTVAELEAGGQPLER